MPNAIANIEKSRGRPKTNATPVLVRLEPDLLDKLDKIAEREGVNRPEAVRRLIERAK